MTTLADLWTGIHSGPLPKFEPVARYIAPMDCLIYLREDCSYRAVRLNTHTTILLHPYDDRPVGVKLKGMRFLHEKLRTILRSLGADNLPMNKLIAFWELAYTEDGEEAMAGAEKERQRQLAERTRKEIVELAADIGDDELELAIA
jgi:hypothetical protein